jgi:hypothetical protein
VDVPSVIQALLGVVGGALVPYLTYVKEKPGGAQYRATAIVGCRATAMGE